MNLIFAIIGAAFITSCALLPGLESNFFSYDYNKHSLGEAIDLAMSKRGQPQYIYQFNEESMYLYKDGYLHFKKNTLIGKGSYRYILSSDDSLSSSVLKNQDIFELLPGLGLPLAIEEKTSMTVFKYNRGVILTQLGKVVSAVDKVYNNLAFNIELNSYSDKSAIAQGAYFLVPGSDKVSPEDFQFKEVKRYLASSLRMQGRLVTENPKNAKYIVFVNYGISDPKEDIQVVSRPIYIPSYIPGSNIGVYGRTGSFLGSIRSSGTWTSQYAGQVTETYKTVSYNRWMNVEAVDYDYLRKTKTIKPVWKVLANSVGSTGDLRYVLPALSMGVSHYIDEDTKRALDHSVEPPELNQYVYDVHLNEEISRSVAGSKK